MASNSSNSDFDYSFVDEKIRQFQNLLKDLQESSTSSQYNQRKKITDQAFQELEYLAKKLKEIKSPTVIEWIKSWNSLKQKYLEDSNQPFFSVAPSQEDNEIFFPELKFKQISLDPRFKENENVDKKILEEKKKEFKHIETEMEGVTETFQEVLTLVGEDGEKLNKNEEQSKNSSIQVQEANKEISNRNNNSFKEIPSLSHVKDATEHCRKQFMAPDEKIYKSWSIISINKWNNEQERLLIISSLAYYRVKYDFNKKKVLRHQKVMLKEIDALHKGYCQLDKQDRIRSPQESKYGIRIFHSKNHEFRTFCSYQKGEAGKELIDEICQILITAKKRSVVEENDNKEANEIIPTEINLIVQNPVPLFSSAYNKLQLGVYVKK